MRMEISCRQARRLASVRRECTVEDRSRLEVHLSNCPNCQTTAHEFELMDRRLGRLPEPAFAAVPPAFARAHSVATGRAQSVPPWPGWRRVIQPLSLVTVLAVVAVAAIVWFGPPPHQALPAGLGTLLSQPEANPDLALPERAMPQDPDRWVWPAVGCISQPYSLRHQALDIANSTGTLVQAVGDGRVGFAGRDEDKHGIHVYIEHEGGYGSFYSHLDSVRVVTGERVERGQVIGTLGQTGQATGPHLHFEMRQDDRRLDPREMLPHQEGWTAGSPEVPQLHWPEGQSAAWTWPTNGHLTQGFSDWHQAYDIANEVGTDVVAARYGVVARVGHDSRHGINVLLDHAEGLQTFYSHLDSAAVGEGEEVSQGQRIGTMGQSGIATGPHLHFQIQRNSTAVDPARYLPEIAP